jgi:lipopolysaccharide transport system ATP-binding protein
MESVGQEGRTVFFVSHNMLAVSRLCARVILLEDGLVKMDDHSHKVISSYLCPEGGSGAEKTWSDPAKAPGNTIARLRAVRVKTADGIVKTDMDIRKDILLEQEFEVLKSGHILLPSFQFFNDNGLELFATDDLDPEWRRKPRPAGRYVSTALIPGNYLAEGTHFVYASLTTVDPYVKQFFEPNVVSFNVVDSFEGDAARGDWPFKFGGVVRPYLKWSTKYQSGV